MGAGDRVLCFALFLLSLAAAAYSNAVKYDGRSLIINGKRELLFSGSIHYPRSTPDTWPDLLRKAKSGGLNVIQTYVFWNIHEPVEGQYNFEGNYDLVKFIKLVGDHHMYTTLRVGPFVQAEWNHGGLPYWLREVSNISFRNDNDAYKHYMDKFVKKVIALLKDAKLFASEGGPIILAQIENEYNSVQRAYGESGSRYVQWAATMAVRTGAGIPWVMCKQNDAPDPVINACNGRNCGDTFPGPNKPYKPAVWTENWTAKYRAWGDRPSQRTAEDIAFSVARWFSKGGTHVNYYMYHGGTNFGRTTSAFTTTQYYDEAPLDEFGLPREPKWGHLKDVHRALRLSRKALLWGMPRVQHVSANLEVRYYEGPGPKVCVAFLTNNNTEKAQKIEFRGAKYLLPARSISILPDCKTVVYNTKQVLSQHSARNFVRSEKANMLSWQMSREGIPDTATVPVDSKTPRELYNLTKDTTDYAWYTTRFDLNRTEFPFQNNTHPILRVASMGHAMLAFVNGEFIGSGHGSHDEKSFMLQKEVKNLKPGANEIALLGVLVGLIDSGANLERRYAGPRAVTLLGSNTGALDLTSNGWGHRVGLEGERVRAYTQGGSRRVRWTNVTSAGGPPTWYKAYFDAPEGKDPIAIRVSNMSKGMIWVNGKSIGRYWESYVSSLGEPTQTEYHIPRSFIKPTDNLIVVFDEEGGKTDTVEILTVNRDTICSFVAEDQAPSVDSWARKNSSIKPVVKTVRLSANLKCPDYKKIVAVEFASFGNPTGSCGVFVNGNCSSPLSKRIVEKRCLGKSSCSVPVERDVFDKNDDGCPNVVKTLAIQARCSS